MRVRQLSRPLRAGWVLGFWSASTLYGAIACNSIIGNEQGYLAISGSGGAAAGAGTAISANGGAPPSGGTSPSGGTPPSGGAPTGGALNGAGAPTGGTAPTGGAPTGGTAPTGGAPNGGIGGIGGQTAGAGGGEAGPYCPGTIKACGGNLVGTWVRQSSCVILPSPDPTIPTECQGGDAYQRYRPSGNVTYTDTTWVSDLTSDTLETLTYSKACMAAFHMKNSGFPALASASTCGMLASNLMMDGATTATCPLVDEGCNCAMTFTDSETTGDTYDRTGNSEYVNEKDYGTPITYCVETTNGVTTLTTSERTIQNYVFEHVLTLSSR